MKATLAEKIRAVMAERGWTAYRLACASGVALATLDRVMRGGSDPKWRTVQRLALALEISTDDLRDPSISLDEYEPRGPGGRPVTQPQPAD